MRTKIARALALTGALGLFAMAGDIRPAAAQDTGADEMTLVAKINAERAAAGLAPLAIDGRLFDSARAWSSVQAAAGDLSHDDSYFGANRPSGAGAVAENVAYNYSVDSIHERLMASPAHRANILDPSFTSIGVGEVISPDGRIFVTERFARMTSTSAAAASPAPQAKAKAKAKAKPKAKAKAKAKAKKRR